MPYLPGSPSALPSGSTDVVPATGPAPRSLHIALITESTYPIVTGGVSTWCDQLVTGLPEHTFDVVALTGSGGERPVWELPGNVRHVRLIPVWGTAAPALGPGPGRRHLMADTQDALRRLWDAALGPDSEDTAECTEGALRQLVDISDAVGLARVLASQGSVAAILEAWDRHQLSAGGSLISVADAVMAAGIVDRALALVDHRLSPVDVVHASSNGPSSLLALAESWRNGTPMMVTEHGVYLRERYLALDGAEFSWPVRRAVTAFLRRLSQVAHTHAAMILPVNQFETQLRLFGPMPQENAAYKAHLVAHTEYLGVTAAVHWEGPSKGGRPAIAAGHVVAVPSVSEGLPFTLIETMMWGRDPVNTDVGGVAECPDDELTARDQAAFAEARAGRLTDHGRPRAMGAAARRRALEQFTLVQFLGRYREAYAAARDGRPLGGRWVGTAYTPLEVFA